MKKIMNYAGAFMVCALVSSTAFGQDITFGAKAGANYQIVTTSYEEEPEEKPDNSTGIGFHVAGYANIMFSDMVGFRPELGMSMRKIKDSGSDSFEFAGTTITTEYESTSSPMYLDVPLLLALQPSEGLQLHVGPQIGLLLANKNTYETTTTIDDGTNSTSETDSGETTGSDATDGWNSLDFGVAVGGLYQVDSGLNFGLRYGRSLNSINEDTEFASSNWNVISFSVGYTFGM